MKLKRVILPAILMSAACTVLALETASFFTKTVSADSVVTMSTKATDTANEISWLDPGHLGVTFNSSTHTDHCQSYQVTFSTQIDTYTTDDMTSYIFIDETKSNTNATEVNAGVHSIEFSYYKKNIIIPRKLTNGYTSVLLPTYIISNASKGIADSNWVYIDSILIPNTITSVQKDAFPNVPDTCTIKCMLSKEEVDTKYTAGWTNAKNIVYGYEPTTEELTDLDDKSVYGTTVPKSNGQNFIIGYIGQAGGKDWNYPLTINYNLKRSGKTISKSKELPVVSNNTCYDSVGDELGGYSLTMNIDLMDLETGDEVVKDSITFTNIYHYTKMGTDIVPNLADGEFGSKVSAPTQNVELSSLIDVYTENVGTFGGYTTINSKVDKVEDAYKKLKPAIYKKYQVEIESGEYTPRYRLTSFNLGNYIVRYKNANNETVSSTTKIQTPIDYVNFSKDKGNSFGISIKNSDIAKDFSASSLVSLSLSGVYFSMDLWSNSTDNIVAKTVVSVRFGDINVFGEKTAQDVPLYNVPVITGISMASFVTLFAAGAVILYLYMKKKFRNDEFKRVKPKKFVISSIKYLIGFSLVAMAILSIIFRCTIFNSTIVTYNPLDVFVIVFTIAGGIFLGFFIKDIVVRVKNKKSNKEKAKLKLDADKVEDGTN